MSNIIGTFRVQADTDLVDVLPDPTSVSKNRNVPGRSGGDFVTLMVLESAADVRLINPGGVLAGGVTQAQITLASKAPGGPDRKSGTYSYAILRGYRLEGAGIDITFSLVEVS